jgi:pilus assembly protein CpaB
MRRQSMLLIGGLVLGLLGATLTFAYVRNVEGRAASKSEVVTAFVAREPIAAGTPGSALSEVIEEKDIPRAYLQPGALEDIGTVVDQFTTRTIVPGQTLTTTDFGQVGQSEGRLPIPKGHEAVAIATTLDGGLGQYATPGDRVSVYATFKQGAVPTTRKLLSNVLVIATQANPEATNPATGIAPGSASGQLLFVLAVTPQQAGKLIYGQRMGEVSLTLIPQGQVSPEPGADDATGGLAVSLNPQGQI